MNKRARDVEIIWEKRVSSGAQNFYFPLYLQILLDLFKHSINLGKCLRYFGKNFNYCNFELTDN